MRMQQSSWDFMSTLYKLMGWADSGARFRPHVMLWNQQRSTFSMPIVSEHEEAGYGTFGFLSLPLRTRCQYQHRKAKHKSQAVICYLVIWKSPACIYLRGNSALPFVDLLGQVMLLYLWVSLLIETENESQRNTWILIFWNFKSYKL